MRICNHRVYCLYIYCGCVKQTGNSTLTFGFYNLAKIFDTKLQLKQNYYPVLFLHQGQTSVFTQYKDFRANTFRNGISFALSEQLLGLALHTEVLLRDLSLIQWITSKSLVVWVWGEDNNDSRLIRMLRHLNVEGIIYDRVNLEVELLQRGGTLATPPTQSAVKKHCFLPLLHVLSLHSKILVTFTPYPDLWTHMTGSKIGEDSTSVSVYERQVPLLLKDPLSLLIQLVLTLSFTIQPEHLDFVVQMLYNTLYTQALVYISCKFSSEERYAWRRKGRQSQFSTLDGMLSNIINWLSRCSLYEEIDKSHTLPAICQSVWSPQSVEQTVQEYCLPFLRVSALMKSHLFNLEIPTAEGESEFQLLSSYLGLYQQMTASAEAFTSTSCVRWIPEEPHMLVRAWCLHVTDFVSAATQEAKTLLLINPTWQKPSLIQLPKRYYLIFQMYRSAKCTVCNETPKDPAICLTCGQFLCFRQLCCTQNSVYESVAHSIQCGAGTGMFLLVNSSIVVVIRGPRATLWGSVYLDEHGEEDRDLKRGKPLYLSQARYKLLTTQWLSHSFDHSCKRWIWHRDQL